jgi:hypothetical protein
MNSAPAKKYIKQWGYTVDARETIRIGNIGWLRKKT